MAPTLLAQLPAWTERLAKSAESGYAWPPGWAGAWELGVFFFMREGRGWGCKADLPETAVVRRRPAKERGFWRSILNEYLFSVVCGSHCKEMT
jgi:hypothetical protein